MDKKRIILNKTAVAVASPAQRKLFELKKLVSRFSDNIDQYKNPNYKEARTRVDFIDKFFELLDWDLSNKQGFSEAYRDVIREDEVRIEGKQKAPDYCFKIGTERKFFVEAKKPSVNIKEDVGSAYQLRRYAYSAKLPLSILTDFHEFAVYDTRIKPRPKDNASVARIFYCQFNEYEQNFDFIYNTFSKNAILKGSFDRYVASSKNKKGTSEVDKEILKLIEAWRSELAKNLASNNKKLDLYNLNTAVQKIIDRIIFLRIAEDRNIEEYNNLGKIGADGNIYKKLDEYFQLADKRYNSGLFAIENWLSDLKIDDKILKDIIKSTYFPESPYEFSVLPVEILGNIYEQFLGKVIRLTASHEAKIEEKPEVKKAGGVYYTPQYIVDYIVKNTVGEKLKDSMPEKVEKIKICDPACGSGSFLLGAYGYLLRWHLDYYTRDKKSLGKYKKQSKIYDYKGDFKLTIDEKKKILKNNIFGVDIDSQAVEVTKLSLLLKLMEDETQQSAGMLIKYSHEALLPDLEHNIKCGNSLIGPDFYESKNMSLFDDDEMRKVNVFDWQKEFKGIFDNGGFDVVIGNPPYIRSKLLIEAERDYFILNYKSAMGTYDIYVLFYEKGISLLKKNGLLSFITPNKYFYSDYGEGVRNILSHDVRINTIIDFNEYPVFKGITTYTSIIIIEKSNKLNNFPYYKILDKNLDLIRLKEFLEKNRLFQGIALSEIAQKKLNPSRWILKNNNIIVLLGKVAENSRKLGDLCYKIYQGFVLTPTEVFPVKIIAEKSDFYIISPLKQINNEYKIEKELIIPIYKSSDLKRYYNIHNKYYAIFPYKYVDNKSVNFVNLESMEKFFPLTLKYLEDQKKYLLAREEGKWKGSNKWYEYSRNQNFECQKMDKILVPGLATEARYSLGDKNMFIDQGSYGIILKDDFVKDKMYILGLLNSKLLDFYLKSISGTLSGGYFNYQSEYLKNLPIHLTNDKKLYNKVVTLVDQMLEVQKMFYSAKTEADKKLYQQKIEILDGQIDGEVYKLYGLDDKEIKIIEGK